MHAFSVIESVIYRLLFIWYMIQATFIISSTTDKRKLAGLVSNADCMNATWKYNLLQGQAPLIPSTLPLFAHFSHVTICQQQKCTNRRLLLTKILASRPCLMHSPLIIKKVSAGNLRSKTSRRRRYVILSNVVSTNVISDLFELLG